MSELKVYVKPIKTNMFGKMIVGQSYYLKSEADKVIAKKDAEIAELKKKLMPCLNGDCILTCEVVEKYGKENEELKQTMQDKLLEAMKYKAENIELLAWKKLHENCDNYIDTLEKKLEDAKASHYAEMVDAGMRERRLKRALYKACANWAKCEERINNMDAYEASEYLPSAEDKFRKNAERWSEMETKCRAKAEEYK